MILSVLLITYNHEKYIREAIEGVLMQQTSFDFELVIGEDCSTDSTREICLEYKQKYPEKIKLLLPNQNIGMMPNFIATLQACQGQYIALCEGDDYWTDPYKLQKQLAFLESNPQYVLSFHNAKVLNVINGKTGTFVEKYKFSEYEAKDLFHTWLIPTSSMVFKNIFNKSMPDFITKGTHGDLAIQVYLNEFGKFHASNEVMSVYRINESSVTINSFSSLEHNNAHIKQLKLMNLFFNKKYNVQIKRRIYLYYLRNANLYRSESIIKPLFWIFKAISLDPSITIHYRKQFINSIKILLYTARVFLKLKK